MAKLINFINGFKEGQKFFGETVSSLVNLVLLSMVYLFGIGITSVLGKIFKKNFLDLENQDSYWQELNLDKKPLEEYYHQF